MATTNENINIQLTVDTTKGKQAIVDYEKLLKELRDEMVNLEVATNGLSEATEEQRLRYAELEVQSGKITDAMGDVNARINANADDYQKFNAALEGLAGGVAVAQGLVGTLDLLGLSNMGVEQVVKTLMTLQGVMNSVNAVQQIFNKDSKVRILLTKMLGETSAKTAATEVVQAGATTTLAVSEKTAEKAQRSLNAAMVANPVMAIVAGIAALVAILAVSIKLINKETEEEKRANAVKEQRAEIDKQISEAVGETQTTLAGYLDVLKNTNVSEDERKILLGEIEKATGGVISANDAEKMSLEELEKAVYTYITALEAEERQKALIAKKIELETEREAAQRKVNERGRKKDVKALKEVQAKYDDVTKALSKNTSEIVKNRVAQAKANEEKKKDTETAENLEKKAEAWKKFKSERDDAQKSYQQSIEDMAIADAEYDKDYDRLLEARKAKRNREYNEELEKYKGQFKSKLITQEQYDALVAASTEKRNNDIAKLETDNDKLIWDEKVKNLDKDSATYWDDYNKLLKEGLEKGFATEKQLSDANKEKRQQEDEAAAKILANQYEIDAKEQEVARIKGRVAGLEEGTPEYFDALIEQAEAQRELELEQLEQDKEAKLLSEEDYQIRKKEIIDKYRTENLQAQRDDAQKEIEIKELTYQAIGEIASGLRSTLGSLQEAELADESKSEKEKLQIQKKYAIASLLINIAESGVSLATSIPKTLEAYADIPVAGPIIAAVQIAATTAAIIAQIAKIRQLQQQINKAARGAYVVGPSHSQGGVPYELEGGEAVLNKRAMAIPQYRALASAMNVSTGGVAFPNTNSNAALTAQVDRTTVQAIVAETIRGVSAIPVVVSESDITNTVRKVDTIVGRSKI